MTYAIAGVVLIGLAIWAGYSLLDGLTTEGERHPIGGAILLAIITVGLLYAGVSSFNAA